MLKSLSKSRQSIQSKLSAIVLGVSLVFALVSVTVQLGITYSHTVDWTTKSLEKRVKSTISTISYSLKQDDLTLLVRQIQQLADMPYVSNVYLIGDDGQQYWADNASRSKTDEHFMHHDLFYQGKDIGDLEIYLDYDAIKDDAFQSATPSALIYIFEAMLVAFLLIVIVRRTFTRRIRALVESVDRIDLNRVNKFAIPEKLTSSEDELGQVARSIQELYMRIRGDFVHNKLKERTLKQHKSLLAEEVSVRAQELEWQNLANKLLADLSLRLLKGHKTNVEHDVRICMPTLAKLFESDHVFWLSIDQERVSYRASYPVDSHEPSIDFSDNYKVKRWLMEAHEVATVDINNIDENAIAERDFLEHLGVHSLSMFPLTDGRKSFGLVATTTNHRSMRWNENKSLLLKRFATMLSELTIRERDHLAMTELQEELIMANERLRLEAETDELTRLLNRRPFSRLFSTALYDAEDENASVTILMIDIDHFKAYNDIYGHLQGDKVLSFVARAMDKVAKEYHAPLARFGGEEFAMLLPKSDEDSAQHVAWELCQTIRDLCIPHQGSANSGIITISIGGIICKPTPDTQPNQLLESADQCLYKAKRAGRNRAELKRYNASTEEVV
ncbi:sensor domain-containing diguanylate cyclase [Grimontia kaedaensis]|uniref:diguanylate cyclase n=1 Tax=Grimontia kaedaensis TaxID=2872157 RepID=A0ABY4X038_9GAMM|nr:sensor domain-containing diguanylate cyclase [Grimontia kaedaensis]USH04587.1 sensor domain-containing diguanylate cyclase [Grimontia kaedaensis]